jgi:hypothetical protein
MEFFWVVCMHVPPPVASTHLQIETQILFNALLARACGILLVYDRTIYIVLGSVAKTSAPKTTMWVRSALANKRPKRPYSECWTKAAE